MLQKPFIKIFIVTILKHPMHTSANSSVGKRTNESHEKDFQMPFRN